MLNPMMANTQSDCDTRCPINNQSHKYGYHLPIRRSKIHVHYQIPPKLQMAVIILYNSVSWGRGHLQLERFTNRSERLTGHPVPKRVDPDSFSLWEKWK